MRIEGAGDKIRKRCKQVDPVAGDKTTVESPNRISMETFDHERSLLESQCSSKTSGYTKFKLRNSLVKKIDEAQNQKK